MPTVNEVRTAILEAVEEFRHDLYLLPEIINRGECETFATVVNDKLDEPLRVVTTADVMGGKRENRPQPWHVWLTDGERHYDSEHPTGAESWGKLNFFQRVIKKCGTIK